MRKNLILLSVLLIASMLLMACGAEETGTPVAGTEGLPTEDELVTEVPETEEPMVTETMEVTAEETGEGVPVTGAELPFLLENQLAYDVWNAENEQIGEVEDMVIDLANSRVAYVHIETGGFLDIGDEESLVPWNALSLAIGEDPDVTSADDNVFILQFDQNLLEDAPDFDTNTMPAVSEPAEDWGAGFADFWSNAGVNTEPVAGAEANELQGVILATNLLDSAIVFDSDEVVPGTDVDGEMDIDNAVIDTSTGQVQFLIVNAFYGDGGRLIPVPLSQFRWDADTQSFIFNGEPTMLQEAPFLAGDLSDTFEEGWQDDYFDYWQ